MNSDMYVTRAKAAFFIVLGLGLSACVGGSSTDAAAGVELPAIEENRFFEGVENLTFHEDRGSIITLPIYNGVTGLGNFFPIDTRPGFPTIEYRRACGAGDFVQVFTTVSLDLSDSRRTLALPDFRVSPERWRVYGFAPGEVINETEFEPAEVEEFSATDNLDGVTVGDPDVLSYQWIYANRRPAILTGAWVATQFEPEEDFVVEVFVFFINSEPVPDEEYRGSPIPFGDGLLDELDNPVYKDRFDCVAETWHDIEPVIAQYERNSTS